MATKSIPTVEQPHPPSSGSLQPPQTPLGGLSNAQLLSKRVVLNVGGVRHEVLWQSLDRLPNSRLGKLRHCTTHEALKELCDDYDLNAMEFYFDRQPRSFSSILNFYQTGKLHLAEDVCILSFKEDLEFWNIDERYLEPCCQHKYHHRKDDVVEEMRKDAKSAVEDFGSGCCTKWRRKLWDLLEKPHTSIAALLLTIVTIVFIIVCTVSLTINTLPMFQQSELYDIDGNGSSYIDENGWKTTDMRSLSIIEVLCVVLLTIEFILRFWATPSKLSFIKDPVNIIDLVANISFYISLMLSMVPESKQRFEGLVTFFQILRLLRLVKLTRYSTAFKSLGHTLRRSWKELGLLLMVLVIEIVVFSSLVYFVEADGVHSNFASIPDAFWWAVVTMTTVGYGDQIPVTIWGKLVGAACCISGVLFIVLLFTILVHNFTECYAEQKRRLKASTRGVTLNLANGSGEIVFLSTVYAQDVNCGGTGGGGGN